MKRFIYSIFILISFCGCKKHIPQEQTVSVLVDRTEPEGIPPSGHSVLELLPNRNLADALELCITNIGDTHYNNKQCFALKKGETGWMANEDKRRKQFRQLTKQFSDTLFSHNKKVYSYQRSDIFRTVAKELNSLSDKQGSRELWLFSDLKEHSFYSVYEPTSQFNLFNNPELVAKEFVEATDLKTNLSGITLRIIYQPSLEDAELFSKLVELYHKILEPKGVIIKVGIQKQIRL